MKKGELSWIIYNLAIGDIISKYFQQIVENDVEKNPVNDKIDSIFMAK